MNTTFVPMNIHTGQAFKATFANVIQISRHSLCRSNTCVVLLTRRNLAAASSIPILDVFLRFITSLSPPSISVVWATETHRTGVIVRGTIPRLVTYVTALMLEAVSMDFSSSSYD